MDKILSVPRLRYGAATLREEITGKRIALALSAAMVVVGVWVRCRDVTTAPMWLDEASWTIRLVKDPLKELVIRPIGFMFIERLLTRVFSPSEGVTRFLPWLAGVTCAVVSLPLARRLFRSEAARLLFVGMITLDPGAIEYSKEFKPYSVSLTLHASLMLLALRYRANGRGGDLAALLALCFSGVLFAQDAVFALPGIFLLVFIETLHARRVRHLVATTAGAAATLALIGSLYVFVWSTMNQHQGERAWGKKYDVFYLGGGPKTEWLLSRYAELAETPAARRYDWKAGALSAQSTTEIGAAYAAVFLVLNLAGLTELARKKKWRESLLIVSPLCWMVGFNSLGFWPFGAFRANLFALVYLAALAGTAVDRLPWKVRTLDFAPLLLLVLLPFFASEHKWHARKALAMSSRFPDLMRTLVRLHGPVVPGLKKDVIAADAYSCPLYKYYSEFHPVYSKTLGVDVHKRFILNCRSDRVRNMIQNAARSLRGPEDRAWVLVGRMRYFDELARPLPDGLHEFTRKNVGGVHHLIGIELAKQEPEPEAQPGAEPEPEPEPVVP